MSQPESTSPPNKDATAEGLGKFIDRAPSPYHVCSQAAGWLLADGFTQLAEREVWPERPGKYFVQRGGGSLVAWVTGDRLAPFRVVAGHTDSPNLRVKQHPDVQSAGCRMVALEPYGGAWLNSWLDRDLGISGRVVVRRGNSVGQRIFQADLPLLRVPQLAIHLAEDRKGVTLNPQRHVNALWGVGSEKGSLIASIAENIGLKTEDVLSWDLMVHDLTPSRLAGAKAELLSAPRLDNQTTCYAGLQALRRVASVDNSATPVLALFDHEEVGSESDRGADSGLLATVLERIVLAQGGGRAVYLATLAESVCLSGDMAHATHPNYPERHDPGHQIALNGGPVIKVNKDLRYATDALSAATFVQACAQAGVGYQRYVHRADLPCGSTVGPMVASRSGISTVDVGVSQLAMHSARELMGADDVAPYSAAMEAFFTPA